MIWKFRHREIVLNRSHLMGVVNLTPDSFSDGGRYLDTQSAVDSALHLIEDGADILDLGAESTRPQASPVSEKEEISRLLPVLQALRCKTEIPISIDTTKPEVARVCLEEGADIINDVSGLKDSGAGMAEQVCHYQAGLVLMHRRGSPGTMQQFANYGDTVGEVLRELEESVSRALELGIVKETLAVDPGLGFSKEAGHNLEILRHIEEFEKLGYPMVIGPSRKSFLGVVTGREVEEREFATAAVIAYCALKGFYLLRVHHVAAMRDVVKVIREIQGEQDVRTFQMGQH